MSSSFPSLPQELLIQIMICLDSHSILHMALSCRSFHEAFRESKRIRYIYELGMNSLQDAGSGKPTDELLGLLRDRQKAWATLEWKSVLQIPPTHDRFEKSAGILAGLHVDGIRVVYLPSSTQRVRTIHHSIHDMPFFNHFAIDANQDLIILVEIVPLSNKRRIGLHCRTISTNEAHPNASSGGILEIEIRKEAYAVALFSMKVWLADNVVASCGAWNGKFILLLWNWTTGLLLFNSCEDVLPCPSLDIELQFDFLRQDAFLLAEAWSGQIFIYRFSPTTPGIPVHVASFGLPPTAPLADASYTRVISGQFQPRPTPGMPFMHLPESRVHTFFINYLHIAYLLFVRSSTFLRYVDATGVSEAQDVPWEVWGERESRFMEVDTEGGRNINGSDAINAHGSRVIHGFPDRTTIEVLDFSSTQARLASPVCTRYGSDNPTIVPRKEVFTQDVVTRLPYWAVSRAMEGEPDAYMIDEERIIVFDRSDTSDIRVYSL
ncbi:unnamed protein product [Cyclocybe aegerita]|uniref:F-box domain-containing protein n=1 Tax=Cyclocybe aegerita TaxID=1973307 RepID=A0A8S0X4A9_CYCAE|nr:unnamed protein product [Cyclocybe aegerita]